MPLFITTFPFPLFSALLKLDILIILGMLPVKINIFCCCFFRYCIIVRYANWNYWYFGKCHLIFWMRINYKRWPPFRNVFWILLRVSYFPLKSTRKLISSMCSISLPRSAILLANPNGSNRFEDVKFILFEFVTLGFTLAISINKNFPLNSTPFNLTNSSQTCFGACYVNTTFGFLGLLI